MTVYAYYRVSTDKQDYETQRIGVVDYARRAGIKIDSEITDNGVSGVVLAKDRKLGKLLKRLAPKDLLIVSELSRLGRSTADVINTCNTIAKKQANCYMVKQNMQIDQSPVGKLMIAIFGAFAEMERDLISQRTKEGMARRRACGLYTGRKPGAKNIRRKTDGIDADRVWEWLADGISVRQVAKRLKLSATTIYKWINDHNEYDKQLTGGKK